MAGCMDGWIESFFFFIESYIYMYIMAVTSVGGQVWVNNLKNSPVLYLKWP